MLLKDIKRVYGIDTDMVKSEYARVKQALSNANFSRDDIHNLFERYKHDDSIIIKLGGMRFKLTYIGYSVINMHPIDEEGNVSKILYKVVDYTEDSNRVLVKFSCMTERRHRITFYFKDNGELVDGVGFETW